MQKEPCKAGFTDTAVASTCTLCAGVGNWPTESIEACKHADKDDIQKAFDQIEEVDAVVSTLGSTPG